MFRCCAFLEEEEDREEKNSEITKKGNSKKMYRDANASSDVALFCLQFDVETEKKKE